MSDEAELERMAQEAVDRRARLGTVAIVREVHVCELPDLRLTAELPVGTVVRCVGCGLDWVRADRTNEAMPIRSVGRWQPRSRRVTRHALAALLVATAAVGVLGALAPLLTPLWIVAWFAVLGYALGRWWHWRPPARQAGARDDRLAQLKDRVELRRKLTTYELIKKLQQPTPPGMTTKQFLEQIMRRYGGG